MALSDQSPVPRPDLVAAARAAANWARARRSTWTHAPLTALAVEPSAASRPARRTGPSVFAHVLKQVRALREPAAYWAPRVAGAVALGAVGVAGGRYLWEVVPTWTTRIVNIVPVAAPSARPAAVRKTTGDLQIHSTPAGAQVIVDGKARGVTPLTLTDLSVGQHTVVLRSDAGTIQRAVTIVASKLVEIDEFIFSGWLSVFAPFDLVMTEGGRTLRLDDRHQVMLPPGRHELRLVNRALGFETVREVELKPGETTRLTIAPPPSSMTVTATEPADVWLDGARVGETPLNALPVNLGTHEIVVKRADGSERRFTVTVTVNPLRLEVDFSKPAP